MRPAVTNGERNYSPTLLNRTTIVSQHPLLIIEVMVDSEEDSSGLVASILTRGILKMKCISKFIRSRAAKMGHFMIPLSLLRWLRKLLKIRTNSAKITEKKLTMTLWREQKQKYSNSIKWLMRCSQKIFRSSIGVDIFFSASLTEASRSTKKAGTLWLQNHLLSILPSESKILLSLVTVIHLIMVQMMKKWGKLTRKIRLIYLMPLEESVEIRFNLQSEVTVSALIMTQSRSVLWSIMPVFMISRSFKTFKLLNAIFFTWKATGRLIWWVIIQKSPAFASLRRTQTNSSMPCLYRLLGVEQVTIWWMSMLWSTFFPSLTA